MNALEELKAFLGEGEKVRGIVFGSWGAGYGEPAPPPVPLEMRGKLLTLEAAAPMMKKWTFAGGGFGSPECYAMYAWTDRRVIWVTQNELGATWLDSAPRNPTAIMPIMPGG